MEKPLGTELVPTVVTDQVAVRPPGNDAEAEFGGNGLRHLGSAPHHGLGNAPGRFTACVAGERLVEAEGKEVDAGNVVAPAPGESSVGAQVGSPGMSGVESQRFAVLHPALQRREAEIPSLAGALLRDREASIRPHHQATKEQAGVVR